MREHHHAASNALQLAQARDRVLPVMDGGKSHRGVEGLVLERKALGDGSHARRCACGTLRTHERRRFHRGYVTAGGLVGAGASPDIQYGPRIAERSPDPCGDPRLGAPRRDVSGSMVSYNCALDMALSFITWDALNGARLPRPPDRVPRGERAFLNVA